jgi:hypothetical protein
MSAESTTETVHATEQRHGVGSARATLILVIIAATAIVTPMLFLGQASGHDFQFHLASWLDVAGQWHEGILFPRWAEWANWGFGEPRFIFYPPASWIAGATLGSVLPWRMVPGAFIWLTIVAAGMGMWRLAREWLPGPQPSAAALFYAVNPYHLIMIYYRSDFAELLASALFPLLLLGVLRVLRQGWHGVPMLAAVFAGIWLSNAPAAVIATYSLVLLFVVGCFLGRSVLPIVRGGAAMAAGFGLAAFYILPAAWERRWVQIAQVITDNLRPQQNFLFTGADNPEFLLFNWKVSGVAMGVMLVAGISAVMTAKLRRNFAELWWMLLALGAASVLLMFPPSTPLWHVLPELEFVQFPWRWLLPLDLAFALFAAAAMGRMRRPWLLTIILISAIGATAALIVPDAWWDSEDIPMLAGGIRADHGYEGTDEYAPLACDRYNLPEAAPRIAKVDPETGNIVTATGVRFHVEQWTAEGRVFSVDSATAVALAPRLVNYPAWEARVDDKPAIPDSELETAQMILPLTRGGHHIELTFRRTWDRTAGAAISAITAVFLLAFAAFLRRKDLPRSSVNHFAHS